MTLPRLAIAVSVAFTASFAGAFAEKQPLFPDDRSLGNPKAPVQMIEYASPSCPHCATFDKEVMSGLKKRYIATGKLHYTLRIFPITPYDGAVAGLAKCAGAKRYFEFISLAFDRQPLWNPHVAEVADVHGALVKLAGLGGVKADRTDACMNDAAEIDRVNRIAGDGETRYGINSVPTIILDGQTLVGEDRTLPKLSARIDGLIAASKKK